MICSLPKPRPDDLAGKENYFHNTDIHPEVGFRWEVPFLLQTRYWKVFAKVVKFLAGILGKVEGNWNGVAFRSSFEVFRVEILVQSLRVTLAVQGVDPGTALKQLSLGSISGLSRTKPSEFHSSGGSSLRPPVNVLPPLELPYSPWVARVSSPTHPPRYPLALSASLPPRAREGDTIGGFLALLQVRGDAGGRPC